MCFRAYFSRMPTRFSISRHQRGLDMRYLPFTRMDRRTFCGLAFIFSVASIQLIASSAEPSSTQQPFDVVVYGATPAGIVAAIQLKEFGRSVLLLEPSEHVGGMTTGGLGATDIGNKQAIGGKAREFYERIFKYYQQESAWTVQQRAAYKGAHQKPGETAQWTFEPQAASKVYADWLKQADITVRVSAKLDRSHPIRKVDGRIKSIPLLDGTEIEGRYFVDATYEGDLLALANVSYTIGRESNSQYGETLNGVQFERAKKHQFLAGVSPYRNVGDPSSGLLSGLSTEPPKQDGSADEHVQAYCIRMTLTDAKENQRPFMKPQNYREEEYELLLRNFEAGLKQIPWHSIGLPNRKTDTNNNTGFSTDYIGMSDIWPEASYEDRRKSYDEHLRYQQGLCWTIANHPRVPEPIRHEAAQWGLTKDEFPQSGGWSPQLYVREARRMVGALVMTEHHCRGSQKVEDSIGMAAYTMDSHNVQRVIGPDGFAMNEGDVQVAGFPPYSISYRSLIPAKSECSNLIVPVCMSASHIAYGSIRMEPVFMVFGQSAASAIHVALDNNQALQEIEYAKLKALLDSQSQILALPSSKLK
jgi:hypothetical protein